MEAPVAVGVELRLERAQLLVGLLRNGVDAMKSVEEEQRRATTTEADGGASTPSLHEASTTSTPRSTWLTSTMAPDPEAGVQ